MAWLTRAARSAIRRANVSPTETVKPQSACFIGTIVACDGIPAYGWGAASAGQTRAQIGCVSLTISAAIY
ncbi:MAG: hypothetical protein P4L76_08300, partial [Beijerinckiaceae bacterium]|nr:hypothetical protein [Beijerinckiaceae bacterium]